ncbi:MAG: UDP-N-acetylglucosamine 1-carboxyvinyltransferase [Candidatus Spechtbacterales bacterium]
MYFINSGDIIIPMMEAFRIRGGRVLEGEISVQGSKNAATKLVAATLLTSHQCVLKGLPDIRDVNVMLAILEKMGARIKREEGVVAIDNSNIDPNKMPADMVRELRSSVVFIGPLLGRFGEVRMPYPGGDKIGARGLDTHFNVFSDLGYEVIAEEGYFTIRKTPKVPIVRKVVLDEFSVTASENLLMAASLLPYKIEVSILATEPHIENLVEFLNKMGADIHLLPNHRAIITGRTALYGAEHEVVRDYIEAGTFIVTALCAGGALRIHDFPLSHLELFLQKLKRFGADFTIEDQRTVFVRKARQLFMPKMQMMIYPGVPTDLQSPIGVLATQTQGSTIVHDPLYERRLSYLKELQKMGAKVNIMDDHRAEVIGPTKLRGVTIRGEDIRGGMSLIIAGLIAEGETILENAYQVDRGYERIEERLRSLGADIERINYEAPLNTVDASQISNFKF